MLPNGSDFMVVHFEVTILNNNHKRKWRLIIHVARNHVNMLIVHGTDVDRREAWLMQRIRCRKCVKSSAKEYMTKTTHDQ